MNVTPRACLVAVITSLALLACPEKAQPPPVPPPGPVEPPPQEAPPEQPPPDEAPPAEAPPPAPPPMKLDLKEPQDAGVAEEPMPPLSKVEVGDYVVYDVQTSRNDPANVFRLSSGQQPVERARVKLIATAVDKTHVTVDVRYVGNGSATVAPRWLESGLSVKMAFNPPRPKTPGEGLFSLPPKTKLFWVEHEGKQYKCRFVRDPQPASDGSPSRRCVGSPARELALGSGLVYAQNVRGGDGNPFTAVLVEAGKTLPDAPAGPLAFEDGIPLVRRQTSPAGEQLSFTKVTASAGQVRTEETWHTRAATGKAAALTYDGANWSKPDVKKVSQELIEWVTGLFVDESLFKVLPEGGTPGASVVYGPTRIDTLTVGIEVPAQGDQAARTFRWLVPARPQAIKTAPVWIRYGSVELNVHQGEHSWKRRVVTFSK